MEKMCVAALSATDPPDSTESRRSERIYTDYFNLRGSPFAITPDPEFLFLSGTHQEVLEKINYGIQCRMGFMVLTGEVGTGKTTLCRALLDHWHSTVRTVYIINPALNAHELLCAIVQDLGLFPAKGASKKELIDQLNQFLLTQHNALPVVIIIDDAQTMPLPTLEDLRLLSNLETDKAKLLQILLVGQPELLMHLNRPEMRQLAQRVAFHCVLRLLNPVEVEGFIDRRLFVVGNQGQVRFDRAAVRRIHKRSGGVPRMINKLCDLSLTAAYADNAHIVRQRHVTAAGRELLHAMPHRSCGRERRFWSMRRCCGAALQTAGVLMAGVAIGLWGYDLLLPTAAVSQPTAVVQYHAVPVETLAPESSTASPADLAGPYILQLGSYASLSSTLRAVEIFQQQGITVHWNAVDRGEHGIWYRVYSGRYLTSDDALHHQRKLGLSDSRILYARWALRLGTAASGNSLRERIRAYEMDCYPAVTTEGRDMLIAGAFVARDLALRLATRIQQDTGLPVEVTDLATDPAAPAQKAALNKSEPAL